MITLKEMLIEEERNLRAILQKAQARLAEKVDGSLEIMHNKGSIQYRHLRLNPQTGKRERVYLAKGDPMFKSPRQRLKEWSELPYQGKGFRSGDDDLVTFMWVNECFDPENPDTYFLEI